MRYLTLFVFLLIGMTAAEAQTGTSRAAVVIAVEGNRTAVRPDADGALHVSVSPEDARAFTAQVSGR